MTDTHEWSRLSDKIAVRDYVISKGLGAILIPLYGVWDNADDIDFNSLPNSFAIKTNHSSGSTIIVLDKASENLELLRQRLKLSMAERFGYESAEPHYLRITPRIMAEQLLPPPTNVDYKIWCINGKPQCIMTFSNRNLESGSFVLNVYDLNWQKHSEWVSSRYQKSDDVPKPKMLSEMIEYARVLSEGFPEVRVDFYHTNQGVFFGEMTFTAACGRMTSLSKEYLTYLGSLVRIEHQ